MKLWIHIGLHKTGTTFLQRYFASHGDWIQEQGILFPKTGLLFPANAINAHSFRGHSKFVSASTNDSNPEWANLVASLRREIDTACADTVLLSSETFSAPRHIEACSRVIDALIGPSDSVRVLVYLRRQDFWLDSFYRAILSWKARRDTCDIGEFFQAERSGWLDYFSRLRAWTEKVGEDNLIIRSYDDATEGPGILMDMLNCLDVYAHPPSSFEEERINASLDRSYVDILRAVNSLPDLTNEDKAEISRFLIEQGPGTRPSEPTSLIDDELWASMKREFSNTNRRIADRFMEGPYDRFLFPAERPHCSLATQRLDFAAACSALGLGPVNVSTGHCRPDKERPMEVIKALCNLPVR